MASRHFPMDQPAHPPDARPARSDEQALSQTAGRSWPVLARIADVSRSEPLVPVDPRALQPSYRVDPAHEYAAVVVSASEADAVTEYAPNLTPPLPKPPATPPRRPGSQRPTTSDDTNTARPLDNAPMPIKLTVGAWKKIEPHREVIRFAALATLIVVAGMSVVLSMGGKPQPIGAPDATATAAKADPALSTEQSTQSAEATHGLTPMTVPEQDTTSTTPAATGPIKPAPQVVVAEEAEVPPVPALGEFAPESAVASRQTAAAAPTEVAVNPIYPTTPFAEVNLPRVGKDLPRVQTAEPAVAELRGVVTETQTR